MKKKPQKVAVIIGAGDATGGAIAKRFAREGHIVVATRRNEDSLKPLVKEIEAMGRKAYGLGCDARDEDAMCALFSRIEAEIGEVDVVVFNIGANVRFSITETTGRVYRKVWEMAAFAGFLAGREAARVMLPRGRGTVIFTGATASLRGGSGFSAFSGAKFALRALAQSMARELGPKGIHVAHSVIDGAIDTAFIRDNFPERYALKEQGGILNPEHIAEQYWQLHQQPRDCWTHELDLRPWIETF
ncbi:SDR family oxidoreductase [Marinobacter sp. NP-4(2019)]|uniref:SDR family oxidoreductase n=1 Tax=Marinobacter sp. NP-4(2019) TaxID=2488665 RepID=UPI000FC3DDC2|nr:SDR family oxidoreductase [Marinobacter sp. NP-4(2019)]AZT83433.1 SDR family oxidoreductase [Marinobacter sp. NP-4(2019)]